MIDRPLGQDGFKFDSWESTVLGAGDQMLVSHKRLGITQPIDAGPLTRGRLKLRFNPI